MAIKLIALLFILPVIHANIQVKVAASDKQSDSMVRLSGSSVDTVGDRDLITFNLNDNSLKNAVERYFGRRPDDAFIRSPTPWGDLYMTYNWAQVSRILSPQRATILGIQSQPTIVSKRVLRNNSTKTGNFQASISENVATTFSSTWDKGGDLALGQDIEYGFDIEVFSLSGKTSFSYTSKWGESVSKSESVTVGSEAGVTVTLEPNQSVVAELYANRGVMTVKVDYEASLSGAVAVNYNEEYKGHHFWSLDVNEVLKSADLPRSVKSSEIIEIGYYSDSKIVIRDPVSMSKLYSIRL